MSHSKLTAKDHDAVLEAIAISRREGISFADALNRQDVLLTKERIKAIKRDTLNHVLGLLDHETPEGLVRWRFGATEPVTASQMFYTVSSWLAMVIDLLLQDDETHTSSQAA